jgi:hypothetical protein
MRTVCCTFAVAFSLALSLGASAQVTGAGSIAYRAPGQCPTQEGFLQRLRTRLGASQIVLGPGQSLDVQIAASDGRYQGRLSLIEPGGRSTTKTLIDTDCEELVNALSLVATLALETDGVEPAGRNPTPATPATSTSPAPSAPPPAPASAPAPTPAPTRASAPAPAPTRASAPAPTRASAPDLETDRSVPPSAASRFGVALGAFVASGPAPKPLFGAVLTSSWTWLATGVLRPTLELGGAFSLSPDASVVHGSASFTWLTARAVAYLFQWPPGTRVAVRGGLIGDVGILVARGHDTTSPATSSRAWGSVGVAWGLDLPVGSTLVIRPTATLETPVRRDSYAFGSAEFFEVSYLVASGGLTIVGYVP